MDDPFNTMAMDNMQFYDFSAKCFDLKNRVATAIDILMKYIFEGHCKDREQWEYLMQAINKAVFMKEYLDTFRVNILMIAEDFLQQFDEWMKELQSAHHN